jgi:hypothetical protein
LLIRIYRTVAAAAVCLLAAVGGVVLAFVSPFALVMVIAVGSIVGGIAATHLPAAAPAGDLPASRQTRHPHAVGLATAAAATVSALLAMAGSAALLGAAAAPVYLLSGRADGEDIATTIDDAEARVHDALPIARIIYLEPDIYRPEASAR